MNSKTDWLNKKIHSQTGASITFALLLFLVCAVVGSVVLTAGTATAGRLSEIAEYDQRYYSVTSAAELLADQLTVQSVTIVREKNTDTTETWTYEKYTDTDNIEKVRQTGHSSTTGAPEDGTPEYTNHFDAANGQAIKRNVSLLHDVAIDMVYGASATAEGAVDLTNSIVSGAWAGSVPYNPSNVEQLASYAFSAQADGGGLTDAEKAVLAVSISGTLRQDGALELQLTNPGDANAKHYLVKMVLTPSINESQTSGTSTVSHTVTNGGLTETEVTRLTETRTTVISWTLAEMKTVFE